MKKTITILLLLVTFIPSFAQIDIREFKGVWTNSDLEDINAEYFSVLKNLRPKNGRLLKTFGFGDKITTAPDNSFDNFQTYIEDNLSGDALYIGAHINTSNSLIPYAWDGSSWIDLKRNWSGITNFMSISADSFFHKDAYNPIIQSDGMLRILPGNVGEPYLTNEARGLWIGYIGREYFDNKFKPDSGFYGYSTEITTPSFNPVISISDTAILDGLKYYKFSNIFDGVQEGLLSAAVSIKPESSLVRFQIPIDTTTHNKRNTAINVYRADEFDGIYNLIQIIDLTRDSTGNVLSGDSLQNGLYYAYIPDLADFTFEQGVGYALHNAGFQHNIVFPGARSGVTVFACSLSSNGVINREYFLEDIFNGAWNLGTYTPTVQQSIRRGDEGGFYGFQTAILDTSTAQQSLAGGVLEINVPDDSSGNLSTFKSIESSLNRAVLMWGDSLTIGDTVKSYSALSPSKGMYNVKRSGDSVIVNFFDTGLTEGEEYPLSGEVSIKVNGKFAKIINDRLWQANIVLDPGGANESHDNWATYSELGQYDVNPVSNAISFTYKGSGAITGLEESFGNPVITKNNIIILINTKGNPTTPSLWEEIQSINNLGNISVQGIINVLGDLYVVYYDGIYRLSPNTLASVNTTPLERLRVSEPIGDTYNDLSLAQKQSIKSEYDQDKSEIIWTLGDEIWAYSVLDNYWREIVSTHSPDIFTLDENANVLVFDADDSLVYSSAESEATTIALKTKTFPMADINQDWEEARLSNVVITYLTSDSLTVDYYKDNDTSIYASDALPESSRVTTFKQDGTNISIQKLSIGMRSIGASTDDTNINRIKINLEER